MNAELRLTRLLLASISSDPGGGGNPGGNVVVPETVVGTKMLR
jgi:hypothetical protein